MLESDISTAIDFLSIKVFEKYVGIIREALLLKSNLRVIFKLLMSQLLFIFNISLTVKPENTDVPVDTTKPPLLIISFPFKSLILLTVNVPFILQSFVPKCSQLIVVPIILVAFRIFPLNV